MKKKIPVKLLIGMACVLLLLLAVVLLLLQDRDSSDPVLGATTSQGTTDSSVEENTATGTTASTAGTEEPTEGTKPATGAKDPTQGTEAPTQGAKDPTAPTEEQLEPPQDLPSSVVIPTQKDPQTGESMGVTFPCQVPGYGLILEKMAPYSGLFVEDGTNAHAQNVAMLMVRNDGDFPVEFTQIRVDCADEELLFDISALPVGETLVVQEKNGKPVPAGKAVSATAMVVQRANMEMSESKVQVTDNGNNTLTIRNLTDETIPTVRVFYKYFMEEEGIFVGGIAFTVRITRLGAGANVTIQPSHYTSKTSRVVMVLTYDSEV